MGQDPGPKMSRRSLHHPTVEDQVHLVGTAEVEVFANDLFEENAATQRAVQDLRQ